MKKVILALAIVSVSFAACNDAEKKAEETTTPTDTAVVAPVVVDTTVKAVVDTAVKVVVDTTKK
jgi:hypothetical protein